MADNKPELQRGLEARHIELIALGGTIGVGLFMGAASTLKWAGPSVLLAYIIAGLFVFFIMRSMKCCSSNRLPVRSPFTRIVI